MVDEYDAPLLAEKFKDFKHANRVLDWEQNREGGKINIERLMTRLCGQMPYDFHQGAGEELGMLLAELKKNRETHKKEYHVALHGYHRKLAVVLKREAERLAETSVNEEFKIDYTGVQGMSPTNHLHDYDNYIEVLENWETNDVVQLSYREFDQYIKDDWSWKSGWGNTVAFYSDKDDLSPDN